MTSSNFCNFNLIEENYYQCITCGTIIQTEDGDEPPQQFLCKMARPGDIGWIEKIKNFSLSLIEHSKNNFELLDETQIEKRFDICQKCEFFQNNTCSQCGCPLLRHRNYISKLSWASSKCPIDKW